MGLIRRLCFQLFFILFIFSFSGNLYSQESILSSGSWYKIRIDQNGVYKISGSDLSAMGMNISLIDPANLRIYGNSSGVLPERNSDTEHIFLQENAIVVEDGGDGSFDGNDYILFYGRSPHRWDYVSAFRPFEHIYNVYDDYTYYFITADKGVGKRIMSIQESTQTVTDDVDMFIDHQFHEIDDYNLTSSGRTFYGEVFDLTTTQQFNFNFPNRMESEEVRLALSVVARSSVTSNFSIDANSTNVLNFAVSGINFNIPYPPYAASAFKQQVFTTTGDEVSIDISYLKSTSSSIAWLNYLEVLAWRKLQLTDVALEFRNHRTVASGKVSRFTIERFTSNHQIWDVTDPVNVGNQSFQLNSTSAIFAVSTEELREYIVFDDTDHLSVEFVEQIANQNYSGTTTPDFIIIAPQEYRSQAERLGALHVDKDGLSYQVYDPLKIYNEFSSGAKDVSGIRNFVKHMYDKASVKPKYLLLFGDASYDYKDRVDQNRDDIPTWQSPNSIDLRVSYMSDDYYGLLEDHEGYYLEGDLELGIGRLPVTNLQEAEDVVDKIIRYSGSEEEVFGDWRSKICLVGDDQDFNAYVNDSEDLAAYIDQEYPAVSIDKIYLDAFPQESTPGGQRFPEAKNKINENIKQGVLVVNYIGHGGVNGWAHERVLEISDINSWTNAYKMPIFVTATCEFTRFDDPAIKSAGELVLLNPNGGGIALLTTTRATSASGNYALNREVVEQIFKKTNMENRRFGDIIRESKNGSGNSSNSHKFVLVGDPALKIALPSDSVATLKINDKEISSEPDTINALSKVKISGTINRFNGDLASAFNGTLYPVVYDKPSIFKTLAQDDNSFEKQFELQSNVLYKGEVGVNSGAFEFEFYVPKDIAYNLDFGKIAYYARSGNTDAWGCYKNVIIGGFDDDALPDNDGPSIDLFLNDLNFANGGFTDSNPKLIAHISDNFGINTAGQRIGHDIALVIDGNTSQTIVLNDYYRADLDSYQSGKIEYQLSQLSVGQHSLQLKAWDISNNSTTAEIDFNVSDGGQEPIGGLSNYPNPFQEFTNFIFESSLSQQSVNAEVKIYTLNGVLVKVIREVVLIRSGESEAIRWNGDTDNGMNLKHGIYPYTITITNSDGEEFQSGSKLIISR